MNQRPMGEDKKVIPSAIAKVSPEKPVEAEQIAFDKADRAELVENEKQKLTKDIQAMESLLKDSSGEDKEQIKLKMAQVRERLKEVAHKQDELSQDSGGAEPTAASDADELRA